MTERPTPGPGPSTQDDGENETLDEENDRLEWTVVCPDDTCRHNGGCGRYLNPHCYAVR